MSRPRRVQQGDISAGSHLNYSAAPLFPNTSHSVIFTNIRSVLSKQEELHSFIESANADIVFLTETWLRPEIKDTEVFPKNMNFALFRCDRDERRGGGVLIAAKNTVS